MKNRKELDEIEDKYGYIKGHCPRCGRTVWSDTGYFECPFCGPDFETEYDID